LLVTAFGDRTHGKKAVESATRACEMADWKDAAILDTLAAACAEAGDFDSAIKWEKRALELLAKDDEQNRTDFNARLKMFEAKKPHHQEAKAEHTDIGSAKPERP
jgi:tetratricopeptide (TPR) repeat protein